MTNHLSLEAQCESIGWPLATMTAHYLSGKRWVDETGTNLHPEEVICNAIEAEGSQCSWCEGGSINLLLKAAALDELARWNLFQDRQDAVRRFLEAQLTLLAEFRTDIINCVQSISDASLQRNIAEICADSFIKDAYPRVRPEFLNSLAAAIHPDLSMRLLEIFMVKPYEYRAGWPDLTVLHNNTLSFVEVKTTDRLHESQLRFAIEVAKPLNLNCKVVQLKPM